MPYCRCENEFPKPGQGLVSTRNPRLCVVIPGRGPRSDGFFAVLHTDRINSPLEAVRAAIVAERRTTR